MPNETIKQVLIRRDGMTEQEANNLIIDAKAALQKYLNESDFFAAEDICSEYFGLEPDYLMELL